MNLLQKYISYMFFVNTYNKLKYKKNEKRGEIKSGKDKKNNSYIVDYYYYTSFKLWKYLFCEQFRRF